MELANIVHELKEFVDSNPITPKNTLTVTDSRYKRVIEVEGYHVEVTLALLQFGNNKRLYQLDIKNKDKTGKPVHSSIQYTLKAAILPTGTECGGENKERRRFILAAEGKHERCRDATVQPETSGRQEVVEVVAHS